MTWSSGVLVVAFASVAHANVVVPAEPPVLMDRRADTRPIEIVTPGERSPSNKLAIAGLAAGGVLAASLGLYFHLDSRAASNDVGALVFTGDAWTQEHQDLVDRAASSRTKAGVFYGAGGALLLGTAIYWILTAPEDETIVIRPRAQPTVAPTEGGAMVGGMWSF